MAHIGSLFECRSFCQHPGCSEHRLRRRSMCVLATVKTVRRRCYTHHRLPHPTLRSQSPSFILFFSYNDQRIAIQPIHRASEFCLNSLSWVSPFQFWSHSYWYWTISFVYHTQIDFLLLKKLLDWERWQSVYCVSIGCSLDRHVTNERVRWVNQMREMRAK